MLREVAATTCGACCVALLGLSSSISVARADVVISSKATANMDCSGGFCEPTASKAVLNVTDLETLLAQDGNVRVLTSGKNVEATNIVVKAALTTPDSTSLTVDAVGAITVDAPVSIGNSVSELELQSGTAGTLGDISFGPQGNITFGSTSDLFDINGAVFTLVGSLPALAAAVKSNPGGFYALANSYDASVDGTYKSSPVDTIFTGYFETLGNTISNLTIKDFEDINVGLFAYVSSSLGFGVVRDLRLVNAAVQGKAVDYVGGIAGTVDKDAVLTQSSITGEVRGIGVSGVGGLVGSLAGTLGSSWSSARIVGGEFVNVGGVVGVVTSGTVENSYATGTVSSGGSGSATGGLAGYSEGTITGSFATGRVRSGGGDSYIGGLVGFNMGSIANTYAKGNVSETTGGGASDLGGLTGYNRSDVSDSYATGAVSGIGPDVIGGVVGVDNSSGGFTDTYWDTTTSGLSQAAGNISNDQGLKGLSSHKLRSGLPRGFSKKVWKETTGLNHGFPYLIDNPPPK